MKIIEKIESLRCNPTKADEIAQSGQALAESLFTYEILGKRIAEALIPELRRKKTVSLLGVKRYQLIDA